MINLDIDQPSISRTAIKQMYRLHKLYALIIQDYKERLLHQYEDNNQFQINKLKIEKFIDAIKYFLNNQTRCYDDIVSKRESGVQKKQKIYEEDINYQMAEITNKLQNESNCIEKKQSHFTFDIPSVLLENKSIFSDIPEQDVPKLQKIEKDSSSEQYSQQNDNYLQKAQKQTSFFIFGVLSKRNIKRVNKSHKINLYFNQMFIRSSKNGRDAFFEQAIIELVKIQKQDAPVS